MKIILFGEFYPDYVRDFNKTHASRLASMNYQEHADFLAQDLFGTFPSFRNAFRAIGYEAEMIVANDFPLQQKWLNEHGVKLTAGPENRQEVCLHQIRAMKPDVFFMGSVFEYYGPFLHEVAQVTPNIITWIACPFPRNIDFRHVKCVLSGNTAFPRIFRDMGLQSERLMACFDANILNRLAQHPKSIPASFIGSLSPQHVERTQTIEWLIRKRAPIEIWGSVSFSRKQKLRQLFTGKPRFLQHHHGAVWGLAMYQTLADSKITVNLHIDIAKQVSAGGNMRTYEATGCGSLLITDRLSEIDGNFTPGRDLVVYNSREDFLEKIRYYLEHEKEAETIAQAGQKTCLERHACSVRILEFDEIIRKYRN